MSNLLTVKQAAEQLNVSRQTMRNIINEGLVEVIEAGTSSKSDRIEPSELERYKRTKRRNRKIAKGMPNKVTHIRKPHTSSQLDQLGF